ncbi:DNA polymerase III subunit beta, partial [Actinomadura adrarensis]
GDEVRIRGASGDSARANESLAASVDGDDVDIAFSPQYLLDGLAGIDTEFARLQCTGPTKAALLTAVPDGSKDDEAAATESTDPGGDTGFRYLAMPVRLTA